MRFKFTVLVLLGILFSSLGQGAEAVSPDSIRFQLIANDGSFFYSCSHALADAELNDWRVACGNRTFTVHFLVKEIRRAVIPRKTIEVIYYISGSSASSQGVWINLTEDAPLHSLVFHQSVDNDAADLVLNFRG